jgi:Protein of unknown function (DUF4232)
VRERRADQGRTGGRDGGAYGDIELSNVGSFTCILRGLPQVAIVQAGGTSLPVQQVLAPDLSLSPVVLPSGQLDAADLIVYWANWCGPPPGPLSVRATLAGGGVVTRPANGSPAYNFVPDWVGSGQPSTVSVMHAYAPPGLAGRPAGPGAAVPLTAH